MALNVSSAPIPPQGRPSRQRMHGDGHAALRLYFGSYARCSRDTPESWRGSRHSRRIGLRRVLGSFFTLSTNDIGQNGSCDRRFAIRSCAGSGLCSVSSSYSLVPFLCSTPQWHFLLQGKACTRMSIRIRRTLLLRQLYFVCERVLQCNVRFDGPKLKSRPNRRSKSVIIQALNSFLEACNAAR